MSKLKPRNKMKAPTAVTVEANKELTKQNIGKESLHG